jgi:hypothetical protein
MECIKRFCTFDYYIPQLAMALIRPFSRYELLFKIVKKVSLIFDFSSVTR